MKHVGNTVCFAKLSFYYRFLYFFYQQFCAFKIFVCTHYFSCHSSVVLSESASPADSSDSDADWEPPEKQRKQHSKGIYCSMNCINYYFSCLLHILKTVSKKIMLLWITILLFHSSFEVDHSCARCTKIVVSILPSLETKYIIHNAFPSSGLLP